MVSRFLDRLWLVAGVLGAAILMAIGWFFFIAPQNDTTDDLLTQVRVEQDLLGTLERRLIALRKENENLGVYKAELAAARLALPGTSGLSDFLRELHSTGNQAGVTVSAVTVGAPSVVAIGAAQVNSLPISLAVKGLPANVDAFLERLQRVQPRAVLVLSLSASPEGADGTLSGALSLTLSLELYVDPKPADPKPADPKPADPNAGQPPVAAEPTAPASTGTG